MTTQNLDAPSSSPISEETLASSPLLARRPTVVHAEAETMAAQSERSSVRQNGVPAPPRRARRRRGRPALRAPRAARRGRHGHGVPRSGHRARPDRRAQVPLARRSLGGRGGRAHPARGARHRAAEPREHRPHLRPRQRGRRPLPDHGVRPGPVARGGGGARRDRRAPRDADHGRRRPRARPRAPHGDCPPRSQAEQRAAVQGRAHQDPRFRHRQRHRRARRGAPRRPSSRGRRVTWARSSGATTRRTGAPTSGPRA